MPKENSHRESQSGLDFPVYKGPLEYRKKGMLELERERKRKQKLVHGACITI